MDPVNGVSSQKYQDKSVFVCVLVRACARARACVCVRKYE